MLIALEPNGPDEKITPPSPRSSASLQAHDSQEGEDLPSKPTRDAAGRDRFFLPTTSRNVHGAEMRIRPLRSPLRISLAALSAVAALLSAVPACLAADCFGGTAHLIRLRPGGVRLSSSITLPGASHESVLGAAELRVKLFDADSPRTPVFEVTIPRAQFRSTARTTRYDGSGAFKGMVRLRNRADQADTVDVLLRSSSPVSVPDAPASGLRAEISVGVGCARTCVSPCRSVGAAGRLFCGRSAVYQPFADQGFGGLAAGAPRGARSPLCGLQIETSGPRCDFLIDDHCLLPYPSSAFLDPDPSTPTGLRIHYDRGTLPRNSGGKAIDPEDWNTLDGFSPGPMIIALFPDTGFPVDPLASGVAFHTDFAPSLDPDHPTVLLRASDGERVLHFGEMDVQTADVAKKAFILRPGRRLENATRYLVAMRHLVDEIGNPIEARLAFRALRDGIGDADISRACGARCAAAIAARRPTLEDVFTRLAAAGVTRSDLLLAWDFTTASNEAITSWMVSMRDQAYALGTPPFTVTSVDNGSGNGRNANIWARIQGTFQAPLFTTADAPGSRLYRVGDLPAQNGFATVPFVVDIPRKAVKAANPSVDPVPARATLWGHGLLGDRFQLGTLSQLGNLYNIVIAAVDMQGMSNADVAPSVVPAIADLSLFHRIPERLHQGLLNHLLLGRLLSDPVAGFNSDPAFQLGTAGAGVIDTEQVFYSGGSQGGIFGATIMALSEEFERGFLAVPGANYSTLLQRSIDFEPFFALLQASYPDDLDRTVLYGLIQQIWDRAEPNGYLPHIVPGTLSDPPFPHRVLLHMATYDSEVSNLATEIMVRSMGIPQLTPVHRSFFQIPEMTAPFDGSALVEIDPLRGGSRCHTPGTTDRGAFCASDADCPGMGDPPGRTECASGIPPLGNDAPVFNNGAHGATRTTEAVQQIEAFLKNGGRIEQFCTGPCIGIPP